tara:strand:+ start:563 stop:985 length:423 start_codon:yes stop_codon:yes gene_type:complete
MDKYFYFRTQADQDADDGIDDSLCLPVRQIRSMNPSSDTAITITFDSVYNTYTGGDTEVVIGDTVVLNITQGKAEEVMQRLVRAMNSSYPAYIDGFVTVADDVTTTYLTDSAGADETVLGQYLSPHITSCGAITIAAANS